MVNPHYLARIGLLAGIGVAVLACSSDGEAPSAGGANSTTSAGTTGNCIATAGAVTETTSTGNASSRVLPAQRRLVGCS